MKEGGGERTRSYAFFFFPSLVLFDESMLIHEQSDTQKEERKKRKNKVNPEVARRIMSLLTACCFVLIGIDGKDNVIGLLEAKLYRRTQ